jgi:hypothetical protein
MKHTEPKAIFHFLASCRAIRRIPQGDNFIYSSLYHALIATYSEDKYHTIFSPIKASKQTLIASTEKVPLDMIHSWKDQYLFAAVWYTRQQAPFRVREYWSAEGTDRFTLPIMGCCSMCRTNQVIVLQDLNFKLIACVACHALNQIPKTDAKKRFGLMPGDLKGLILHDGDSHFSEPQRRNGVYYSGAQLYVLAQTKDHSFTGPADPQASTKKLSRNREWDRRALVECATLLIGGVSWETDLSKITKVYEDDDETKEELDIDFDIEFVSPFSRLPRFEMLTIRERRTTTFTIENPPNRVR